MGYELKFDKILEFGDLFDYSLTLVNVELPDSPLVYVNNAFLELTQYTKEEVLGKNCRFLQGPDTDKEDTSYIRNSILQGVPVFCDLLNYKKNGDWFFNRLALVPTMINEQKHYIGMQIDSSNFFDDRESFRNQKKAQLISEGIMPQMEKIESLVAKISGAIEAFSEIKPEIDQIRSFVIDC